MTARESLWREGCSHIWMWYKPIDIHTGIVASTVHAECVTCGDEEDESRAFDHETQERAWCQEARA